MAEKEPNEEELPNWLFHEYTPGDPISYEKFLEKYYPNETNRTPDPIEPELSWVYRKWRRKPQNEREKHPNYNFLMSGEASIYGEHEDITQTGLRPVYGPPTYDQLYLEEEDFGKEYEIESHRSTTIPNYLNHHGYYVAGGLTRGGKLYDHQIWRVRNANNQEFACKVVSFHCFYNDTPQPRSASRILAKMLKESEVLIEMNHDNIIRVLDVIKISDRITEFDAVFLAIVMELMEGSIDGMSKEFMDESQWSFQFPPSLVADMTCQMIPALDYIHNRIPGFACVHQAIRPANILYRHIGNGPHMQFKLTDFEECFTFNRAAPIGPNEEEANNDVLQDYQGIQVYKTHCCAPEVWNANSYQNLRLKPNDVFSLAGAAVYLLAGETDDGYDFSDDFLEELHQGNTYVDPEIADFYPQFLDLLRLMTDENSEQRITAFGLIKHQNFEFLSHFQFY